MIVAQLRAFIVLVMTMLALGAFGCTRSNQNKNLQKTNAFTRFKKIESINLQWRFRNGDITCDIPESKWGEFESMFEYGTRDANDQKRVAFGELKIVADGEKYNWAVLDMRTHAGDDECGLLIIGEPQEL